MSECKSWDCYCKDKLSDAVQVNAEQPKQPKQPKPDLDLALYALLELARELHKLRSRPQHNHPPCNCDLTCEDFVTLHRLLTYLRDKHGCEAAWKETIAALARTIRVGKEGGHGH